jgi:hypothetical protein
MNDQLRRPIAAAICCLALAWTASASAGNDKQGSAAKSDRVAAATSGTPASGTGGQPTAGGNSAEPEKTKKGSGAVGPTTGRDDRNVPNPTTGKPLPTQGGNSPEPERTGATKAGGGGAAARSGTGTAPNPSKTVPSAGGNSAEPDKSKRSEPTTYR